MISKNTIAASSHVMIRADSGCPGCGVASMTSACAKASAGKADKSRVRTIALREGGFMSCRLFQDLLLETGHELSRLPSHERIDYAVASQAISIRIGHLGNTQIFGRPVIKPGHGRDDLLRIRPDQLHRAGADRLRPPRSCRLARHERGPRLPAITGCAASPSRARRAARGRRPWSSWP